MLRTVGIQDPAAPRHITHDPYHLTNFYLKTCEKYLFFIYSNEISAVKMLK